MFRSALFLVACSLAAQPLYTVPQGVETRWASPENPSGERGKGGQTNAGRKGRAYVPVKAGERLTLAEVRGSSGTVRRIWVTINKRTPQMLRGLKIEMYWDGASRPAVRAPLGDFFGMGLGRIFTFESALFSSPEGRSFNCNIPMPFRTGMKIVIANESGADLGLLYYDVDYTLGDKHDSDALYFHAHYRRENPTRLQQDYELLPRVTGRGRFLGVNAGVIVNEQMYASTWWGEGEVKIFLDGDKELPTLNGTGTEDYIGTGWGQGRYSNLYQGCPFAEGNRFCFYRYHVPDPVYFQQEVRVTIQQIGHVPKAKLDELQKTGAPIYEAGPGLVAKKTSEGLFERQDDWSSCAYFYLDRPENNLPDIDPVELRTKGL